MNVPVDRIRNIGFMAHIDAGKTTTTERILYYTGVTYKMGEVHDGTAVMDWMDQEQERGITITSAATTCFWNDYQINIIDTPGHVDFTAEVERSLRVLDGAIIVLCGVGGVEPQTEKVWWQTAKYQIPQIVYINKLDRIGADYADVVTQIEDRFKVKTLLLQLPLGMEENFAGVIDLISLKTYRYNGELLGTNYEVIEIPEEYKDEVEVHREHLIETLADIDLEIMELFLEKKPVPEDMLRAAVGRACLNRDAVPIVMGASFKNKGVQNLLDAIVSYLPSPTFKEVVSGISPKSGKPINRTIDAGEPLSAMIFKVMTDPHVGQLVYFRVYSGVFKSGSTVYNSSKGTRQKISRLLRMHSNKREEIKEIGAGNIAATVGLKDVSTGDTLCDERNQIVLDTITFPDPVVSTTIEPRLSSEHDRLDDVLSKLTLEDPTLKYRYDGNTGQSIISGMGELHLEVIKERIRREFRLETKMGKPRVAYKETVRRSSQADEKYVKQAGGKGQYGHVMLEVSPYVGKEKYIFKTKVKENQIPKEFYRAIEMGIRESLEIGVIAGYPITNVQVTLTGGSFQEEDSSELPFKIAASLAFQKAFKGGDPIMLEPLMSVEVVVPEEYLGEVINDFNSRDGKVTNMEVKHGLHVIDCQIPLASMFGYATALRTITQGRANYSMEFNDYIQMSDAKMKEVLQFQLGIYTYN